MSDILEERNGQQSLVSCIEEIKSSIHSNQDNEIKSTDSYSNQLKNKREMKKKSPVPKVEVENLSSSLNPKHMKLNS